MAKSFNDLLKDGSAKRADSGIKLKIYELYDEPGFNPAGRTDQDDADDESLYQHIIGGGKFPDLEVRPRESGGAWTVDGHRRKKNILRAIDAGLYPADPKDGEYWVGIKQFIGNDIDRVVRIATSNEGKKLTPLQLSEVYKRLVAFDLTHDDIAKRMNKTRAHVDQILILGSANHDVQAMVRAGSVSATTAIKATREHKEGAGAVLGAAMTEAVATGKARVTASTMTPWSPPAKLTTPMIANAARLVGHIPADVRARWSNAASAQDPDEIVTVEISAHALGHLLRNLGEIDERRDAAEAKKREKVARLSQAEIPGLDKP